MSAEEFTKKLHRLVDPGLVCYWNPIRNRFVIDRCTHPESSSGLHKCSISCLRTNVMVVEDNGQFRALADDLIGALHAMDAWSNYGSVDGMVAAEKTMLDADTAERNTKIDETYDELAKDNKRQLREAFHLIQQHDTARINQ